MTENNNDWWRDPDFQDRLVLLLVHDAPTLAACTPLLTPDDFRPTKNMPHAHARWLVAERALEYYGNHNEPIGRLIRADVLEYASALNLGASQVSGLRDYLLMLKGIRPAAPDSIIVKVTAFKSQVLKKAAIEELTELQLSGQLTDERWDEIGNRVTAVSNAVRLVPDPYLDTLESRIDRRIADSRRVRIPWTFIEPLDAMVHTVGPKQLGMVLAPYKRGKSLFLLWMATALLLQRHNVLYLTLEDPRDVAEDRLDSIITSVPLKNLMIRPNTLRRRFERYKNLLHSGLHLVDGTGGGMTVAKISQIVKQECSAGFIPTALIVDYDEEISPSRTFREKRFETDEVYRQLRQLCANHYLIGWTAAQTQRDTRNLKILTGDRAAEDIGKARKVTCCISMGKGEWTSTAIYLWIAAHKTDKMDCGCTIIPDLERSIIYDREATSRVRKLHPGEN